MMKEGKRYVTPGTLSRMLGKRSNKRDTPTARTIQRWCREIIEYERIGREPPNGAKLTDVWQSKHSKRYWVSSQNIDFLIEK